MAPRKPQTEKKAKGLVGWKDGKPSKTAPNKVGDYKGKTLNLTNKQLGKAGTAAAQKRTVNISNTKYDTGSKKVLGPAGKPLTGKVDLGGGNIAVYKNGVRVRAAAKKTAKPSSSTAGKPQKTITTVTPKQRGEDTGGKNNNTSTQNGLPNKNLLNLGRAAKPKGASSTNSRGIGSMTQSTRIPAKPTGPKVPKTGATKTLGGRKYRWNGYSWKMIG